jgi:hypothetical protein
MAPRKTTKTTEPAAEANPAEVAPQLEVSTEQTQAWLKEATIAAVTKHLDELLGKPTVEITNVSTNEAKREVRFTVALAVWPKIVTELEVTKLDDENEAGACARIAFEYADAFIAQSKKVGDDGEL